MGRGRKWTAEEIATANEIAEKLVDNKKFGAVMDAADMAYRNELFPADRNPSSISSYLHKRIAAIRYEREANKAALEAANEATVCEQVTFTTTVAISEQMLREKHKAEDDLARLKQAIIGDAIGTVNGKYLMYCFASINDVIASIWPDEVGARLRELGDV